MCLKGGSSEIPLRTRGTKLGSHHLWSFFAHRAVRVPEIWTLPTTCQRGLFQKIVGADVGVSRISVLWYLVDYPLVGKNWEVRGSQVPGFSDGGGARQWSALKTETILFELDVFAVC